jgi:hypothetical protein
MASSVHYNGAAISMSHSLQNEVNCETRTDSKELGPYSEAVSRPSTQELPNILWNLKVHYSVEKSP